MNASEKRISGDATKARHIKKPPEFSDALKKGNYDIFGAYKK